MRALDGMRARFTLGCVGRERTVHEAHGADVGRLLLVAPLVEEAADLVHPAVAHVALHPPLLCLLIILPLFQLILRHESHHIIVRTTAQCSRG